MTVDEHLPADNAYRQWIEGWRAEREAALRAPDGWLSLTGLYWLSEGSSSAGSAPYHPVLLPPRLPADVGVFHLAEEIVTFTTTLAGGALVDGELLRSAVLRHDVQAGGASVVQIDDVLLHVIRRGDAYGVRVRDPQAPARLNFAGRRWYPIDPGWSLLGRFTPHPSPLMIEIENSIGMATLMSSPGVVSFVRDGEAYQLIAFTDEDLLWLIFRDATSGHETYGRGRFLKAVMTDEHEVELDFNQAYNPPCAFSDFATCPLPPRDNYLPIAVQAGEK